MYSSVNPFDTITDGIKWVVLLVIIYISLNMISFIIEIVYTIYKREIISILFINASFGNKKSRWCGSGEPSKVFIVSRGNRS